MPQGTFSPTSPEALINQQATQYQISRQTLYDPGTIPIPAAGPAGTPLVFARTHAPVEHEVISWVATSDAGPPVAPSPYGPNCPFGLNENRVLMSAQVSAIVPTPIGGGTPGHSWSMSGVYVYCKVQPEGVNNNMPLGVMPWEQNAVQPGFPNFIPGTSFIQGILDPTYPMPLFSLPTTLNLQMGTNQPSTQKPPP